MRYRLCGELKLFSHSIISMEGQQENEFADDMRGWAAHQKISGKTVDLLIKEGFDSMEALILIDSDDLSQTKIQRGQQKLLLKALLSLKSSGEDTGSTVTTGGDDTAATGARNSADVTIAGDGMHAGGTQQQPRGEQPQDDLYARLMAYHMRSMQGMQAGPTTSGNAIVDGHRGFEQKSGETAVRRDDAEREPFIESAGRFGTMPGAWQDPQIHLRSAASGRSAHPYHGNVDFVGKYTDCKFVHSCSYNGCGQAHSASTHMQGQSYNHTR